MDISRYITIWIEKFNAFIDNIDIDPSFKEEVKQKLIEEKNINRMIENEIYNDKNGIKTENIDNFFECLQNKYDANYFKEIIEYILSNEESTVIDKFIKYIVITNYSDIKVNIIFDETVGFGEMHALLYGINLGTLVIEEHSTDGFLFDWFHIRKDLENAKIGTLMMNNLVKYIIENYKNAGLYAQTVSKGNLAGINFYRNYGFKDYEEKELEYCPGSKEIISIIITPERMKEVYEKNKGKLPNIEEFKSRRR